jgi:hypothetical protein
MKLSRALNSNNERNVRDVFAMFATKCIFLPLRTLRFNIANIAFVFPGCA